MYSNNNAQWMSLSQRPWKAIKDIILRPQKQFAEKLQFFYVHLENRD
jgi:hypothetical protein